MIRKLKSGKYRLYSRKKDAKTGKRRNLGTFATREAARKRARRSVFQAEMISVVQNLAPAEMILVVEKPHPRGHQFACSASYA